jgi:hypothetical protein
MRFAYTNEIDSLESTALTPLTASPGFGIENVQDQRLSTKWMSSTATSQTVTIAFASTTAASINTIAILGHNLLTTDTVLIQANDADSWGSPSLSTTLTVIGSDYMVLKMLASSYQHKYWQYTFSGQGSYEIGRLWLGSYITIDPSSTNDFNVTKKRSDNVVYGTGRQKFSSPGVGWRAFDLSFPPTKTTALNVIQTFYDTVGKHSSFIFMNFDTIRDYEIVEPCYVSVNGDIGFSHQKNMIFTYSILMEEDL